MRMAQSSTAKEIFSKSKSPDQCKMQGHWLLARMGKRVLRPGGLELTKQMLNLLDVQTADRVVEFAPGLGITARLVLNRNPAEYTAIEADEAAAKKTRSYLSGPRQKCLLGSAEHTGLSDASASVVYGEAMLTMHPDKQKKKIIKEAHRLLQSGGRYGIHEICLIPDSLDEKIIQEIRKALSSAIHVGATPSTMAKWREFMESEGFVVKETVKSPLHLLEPGRLVRDEGLMGAGRFIFNVLRNPEAKKRVFVMRNIFKKYKRHLSGFIMVGVK
jgi:ubiquinone/menaquinone biosynthesis C-methylase UbiE